MIFAVYNYEYFVRNYELFCQHWWWKRLTLLYAPNYNESIAISGKHGLALPQAANYVNIDCDLLETTLTLSSHELNSKLRSYRRWITMILIVIDIKKAKQLQPTMLDRQLLVTSMTNDTRYYSTINFILTVSVSFTFY